jgi:hypothetical protein
LATDKELAAIFTRLAEAYPNYELPEESMRLYAQCWAEASGEALAAAVYGHIRESKWFPAIAEILERAKAYEKNKQQAEAGTSALEKIRQWKREALGPGESRKMLTALTGAASKRKGTEIVPFRGRGVKQMLAEVSKRFEVGAGETDEQFEERKRALMEKAGV